MRSSAICAAFLLAGIAYAQDAPSVEALIKQLGSADFRKRDAAMKALLDRPDAEPNLRAAMQSRDIEIANRATTIIEDFENRPFRELDKAIAKGQVERTTELIAGWRANNPDKGLWKRIRALSSEFTSRHGIGVKRAIGEKPPRHLCMGGPFTSSDFDPTTRLAMRDVLFLAREIDLGLDPVPERDKRWDPGHWAELVAFSSGSVSIKRELLTDVTVFAVGHVNITGNMQSCLVVSGGNVTIDGTMVSCIVIAKGPVTWRRPLGGSVQIISGKAVAYNHTTALPAGVVVVENESNPLGYIHWQKQKKLDAKDK